MVAQEIKEPLLGDISRDLAIEHGDRLRTLLAEVKATGWILIPNSLIFEFPTVADGAGI